MKGLSHFSSCVGSAARKEKERTTFDSSYSNNNKFKPTRQKRGVLDREYSREKGCLLQRLDSTRTSRTTMTIHGRRLWRLALLLAAVMTAPSAAVSRKSQLQRQTDVIVSNESFSRGGIERRELATPPDRELLRMGMFRLPYQSLLFFLYSNNILILTIHQEVAKGTAYRVILDAWV